MIFAGENVQHLNLGIDEKFGSKVTSGWIGSATTESLLMLTVKTQSPLP